MRHSILANDIDGPFNCVQHRKLNDILRHYTFPKELANTIQSFNEARKIVMAFDNEAEEPVPFDSSVPQGSHLSPMLFVTYAGALQEKRMTRPNEQVTTYIDYQVLIQGAKSQKFATAEPQ